MVRILERLSAEEFEFAYAYPVVGRDHSAATCAVPRPGPWFPIRYLGYTRPVRWQRMQTPVNLIRAVFDAVGILRKWRPDLVLAVGCASAVPLFAVARLSGIPTVFVESLTRTQDLSTTGKIIHHLGIASRMFVQWPALQAKYPGAVYAGAVV